MRICRLEFGKAIGSKEWGFQKGNCGCIFLDLGKFYIVWVGNECKCMVCKRYNCSCENNDANA